LLPARARRRQVAPILLFWSRSFEAGSVSCRQPTAGRRYTANFAERHSDRTASHRLVPRFAGKKSDEIEKVVRLIAVAGTEWN